MLQSRYSVFCGFAAALLLAMAGCRGYQHAHVLEQDDRDLVGSHAAGAETWKPLIEESVCKLLARSANTVHQASHTAVDGGQPTRTVCFVGV